jgi:hypothetical protein
LEQKQKFSYRSLLAIPLFLLCNAALFPYLKNVITPDDASYMRIAEYYAGRNFHQALNAYWSPLGSITGAAFAWTNIEGIILYKYILIADGCLILFLISVLCTRFELQKKYHILATAGLIPFLLYACYQQLSGDMIQLPFVLVYCIIVLSGKYRTNVLYAALCGFIIAIAFYAKFYSLYFMLLHFFVINASFFLFQKEQRAYKAFFLRTASATAVTLLCIAPWVYWVSLKYGTPMLNYTGKINASWFLLGHREMKEGMDVFLPPASPSAYNYWEEPMSVQGPYRHFWESKFLLARQVFLLIRSVKNFVQFLGDFSPFVPFIYAYTLFRLFTAKRPSTLLTVSAWMFLIMPLGYFLIVMEYRFLLLICIFCFAFGIPLLQQYVFPYVQSKAGRGLILTLFTLSFSVNPVYELIMAPVYGNKVVANADELKKLQLKGSYFTNNSNPAAFIQSYLIRMQLYGIEKMDAPKHLILSEIRKYGIDYYFYDKGQPDLFPCDRSFLQLVDSSSVNGYELYKVIQ